MQRAYPAQRQLRLTRHLGFCFVNILASLSFFWNSVKHRDDRSNSNFALDSSYRSKYCRLSWSRLQTFLLGSLYKAIIHSPPFRYHSPLVFWAYYVHTYALFIRTYVRVLYSTHYSHQSTTRTGLLRTRDKARTVPHGIVLIVTIRTLNLPTIDPH